MEERSSHFTVVIGASKVAEELRRLLVQHGVAHAGVTTHLRGLRKTMVLGETDLVIVCIALDQHTLHRHGDSLRKLLGDCHCFPQEVRSVGLLTEIGLTAPVAEMGCDVYAQDSAQAATAVKLLARRWEKRQAAKKQLQPSHLVASERFDSWMWGTSEIPHELMPLLDPKLDS